MRTLRLSINAAVTGLLFILFITIMLTLLKSRSDSTFHGLHPGNVPNLRKVDWSLYPKTLIVAIRPGCPWCAASAGFYRDIQRFSSPQNLHIIVISPDAVETTRAYLHSLKVTVNDVLEVDFAAVGISGTPTLFLVGHDGRIESIWIGKLNSEGETHVFRTLNINRVQDVQ